MKVSSKLREKPTIHLYTICWNEEYLLPYFFRYYNKFVDRYVFYDDGSTDQTLSILEKHPRVEIRHMERLANKDSYVLAAQKVHNTCWKESRGVADWVFLTPVDEFLYAPNLIAYLARCTAEGVTAIPALGYQMISRTLPSTDQDLPELVKRGCPYHKMNKLSVFNPDKIIETNQAVGRHAADPIGEVNYPTKDELLLLHYKYLSFEATFNRHAELLSKLGSLDKEEGFGFRYQWTRAELQRDWDNFEQNSVANVFSRFYNPHRQHSPLATRWWRKNALSTPTNRNTVFTLGARVWVKIPETAREALRNFPPTKMILKLFEHLFWNENV